ncbi:hypothetical protein CO2235_150028 [Cupriavidus oxalaticus]|uniref:Uncharacterized protein n=1 Tax=Cupriavidus oxalaticus TaxID=96344 RepID=A0A976BAB5_9BURK|nr:hypothetical protein CO2235_150028 [Cupriavidus oxalaticus]
MPECARQGFHCGPDLPGPRMNMQPVVAGSARFISFRKGPMGSDKLWRVRSMTPRWDNDGTYAPVR